MKRELRAMGKQERFETTNLPLAASLLAIVPDSSLIGISPSPSVDGKRVLMITYPADQELAVKQIVEEFSQRRLVVSLYFYNRALNLLRDQLNQQTDGERCYDRRVESTIP